MTNAELLAKIKAEIERLKSIEYPCDNSQQETGFFNALDRVTDFINSLETETTYDTQQYTPRPSVDIADVARVQFAAHTKVFDKKRKAVFDWEQFKEVAGIFYGFGKKDTLESEKPMVQDELEEEIREYMSNDDNNPYDWDWRDKRDCARHFAQWGAEHAKIDVTDFCKPIDPGIAQCIADHSWEMLGEDEKPVPNDLEEAAKKYATEWHENPDGSAWKPFFEVSAIKAFITGAKWQAEQLKK